MKIAKAPIPINELGKPKTSACLESITLLQFKTSFILQDGLNCASFNILILSIVNKKEAINPLTAPKSMNAPEKRRLANRFII